MTVQRNPHAMNSSAAVRTAHAPTWRESLLFLLLMSGPPKFRGRDPFASLEGAIDSVVVVHIAVWLIGGLWVLARVYPAALQRGILPAMNPPQKIGILFIAALTLSLWDSPGILLTAFTLGQFAVMLLFAWVFTHRFGTSACLRHLFIGVSVLAVGIVVAAYLAPELVTGEEFVPGETRLGGDFIADAGSVAVIGLVCCLSNTPVLRGSIFWAALSVFGALLATSRTRSAYVAFVAFLAIGFIHGKQLRVRKLILPLATVAFIVVLADAVSLTTDYLLRERESVDTMSGRIPLWQHSTDVVLREAPIIGLGYHAATRIIATEYNPGLGNAHSAFFEVLVGGGLLGAGLYVVLCGSLAVFAVRLLRVATGEPSVVAAVGLFSSALLMGITSPTALHPGPLGFAFWSLTAILPALLRQFDRARITGRQRAHAAMKSADSVRRFPSRDVAKQRSYSASEAHDRQRAPSAALSHRFQPEAG